MARELITIRLDSAVRSRLWSQAARRGVSPSAAVRLAIDAWLVAEEARADLRPYDALADLLGRVESKPGRGGAR